jgi:hypothetical protein
MRVKIFSCVLILLMLNTVWLCAQPLPCGDVDPDAVCPLDTWVIVLATGSFAFAVIHLFRKKRAITL